MPGMSTKVSTVKGTPGGKVQTVKALENTGDSASIISRDLTKKLNKMVFENAKARLDKMVEGGRERPDKNKLP